MPDNNFRNDPILIMGMPRSGTSMMVQILEMLGVDVNKPDPNPFDPEMLGYGDHHEIRSIVLVSLEGIEKTKVRQEAINLVREKVYRSFPSPGKVWGFKINSANKHLDIWLDALPNAKIVYIYRESMSRHYRSPEWLNLQREYKDRLYRQLEKYPNTQILEVHYDDIVAKPKINFQKIADFCGVPLTQKIKDYSVDFVKIREGAY